MKFHWRAVPFVSVRRFVEDLAGSPSIVAVDGRGGGGKTTLAGRLAAAIPGACVVHTDDIAWRQAVLDWPDLLREGVVDPVRAGRAVSYRPPQWDAAGRDGSIEVPASCTVLVVEGVGAGRRSLADLYDAVIWVEADPDLIERRNALRIAAGEVSPVDHESWLAEQVSFVEAERTWERADLVVAGFPVVPYDPATEVVVAAGSRLG